MSEDKWRKVRVSLGGKTAVLGILKSLRWTYVKGSVPHEVVVRITPVRKLDGLVLENVVELIDTVEL